MIRLILLILDLIIIAVASLFCYPLSRLIRLIDKDRGDMFSYRFAQLAMKSFLFYAGTKVEYKGLENIPEDEAVVFIGNHRGFFDVVATYAAIPRITGFIAKKELRFFPVVGWWMGAVYCVFLDRENKRKGVEAILRGVQNVKEGKNMLIYPEGKRSKQEGVLLFFHPGSFRLATKSDAKIIPVVSNNSSAVWEDHLPFFRSAHTCIEFCSPVETAGLTAQEQAALPALIKNIIQERLIANGKALGSLPADFSVPEDESKE